MCKDVWMWTHTHNLALEEKVFGSGGYHKGQPLAIGFDQVHSCFSKAQGNRTGETLLHFTPITETTGMSPWPCYVRCLCDL